MFGADTDAALDLLELLELAWHDCYGETSPPQTVLDDVLTCSGGRLDTLAHAARLAVDDFRDLRLWADDVRENRSSGPRLPGEDA